MTVGALVSAHASALGPVGRYELIYPLIFF